jgi:hypothetical protein
MENINFKNLINDPKKFIELINSVIGADFSGPVGVRSSWEEIEIGNLENSSVWNDGEYTDEKLNGTCALLIAGNWAWEDAEVVIENIKNHAKNAEIYGNHIALVIGENSEGGEDYGEIVISNAKAIAIL